MWHHRGTRFVIVLLTLFGMGSFLRFAPTTVHATPPLPTDIVATLPLGAATTQTFTLVNTGTSPLTLTLYEAYRASTPIPASSRAISTTDPLTTFPPIPSRYLVYLSEQADLTSAYEIADWSARGERVYQLLTSHAAQSQARLQAELMQRGYSFRSYWVVNAIAVEADAQTAQWLAEQPEVAAVGLNHQYARELPTPEPPDESLTAGVVGWHLKTIGAFNVWQDFGVEGAGITVAALDSGVLWNHTALQRNYRGYQGGTVDHNYNWMDIAGNPAALSPIDPLGHGTHVVGTMAGRRGTDIVQSGVAPSAHWIAVRGCGTYFCLEADVLEAAQWLLAPTDLQGSNPRPDLRPHIINNSWGFSGGGSGWFEGVLLAWRAAGIFAPFAAGNSGPACGTIDTPALSPNAFAIGAVQSDSTIAPFSAHGPTYDGRVKPDLVAPGTGIYAPYSNGRFVSLSGTSMATPMVAGSVALLWSANPALMGDVATTEAILRDSATPLYTELCNSTANSHPNNVFGMGLLNVVAAVREARTDVPWFATPMQVVIPAGQSIEVSVTFDASQVQQLGTYHGRIAVATGNRLRHTNVTMIVVETNGMVETTGRLVDADSGQGVAATIAFRNGPTLQSNLNGEFSTHLLQGEYHVTATAFGYLPFTATATLTDVTYLEFKLTKDAPRLELSPLQGPLQADLAWAETVTHTVELRNRGSQPLIITPTIPADEWQILPLTFTVPYQLETFEVLPLSNEQMYTLGVQMPFQVPLFGRYITHLYPSSNGWIATAKTSDPRRTIRCLPTGFAYDGMLAPFWSDLDPSQGGTIKVGLVDEDTFVVSYEAVPARANITPVPANYTFQVVFRRDGAIEYRYGQMGVMPSAWAIGMSSTQERAQSLACVNSPRILGYQGWQLRNQTSPRHWTVVDTEPITIPPGDTVSVSVGFRGFSPSPWLNTPMRGRVQFQTNDPYHPATDVYTAVTIRNAPHHVWLGFTGYKTAWHE